MKAHSSVPGGRPLEKRKISIIGTESGVIARESIEGRDIMSGFVHQLVRWLCVYIYAALSP